jgi:hypothetical protein
VSIATARSEPITAKGTAYLYAIRIAIKLHGRAEPFKAEGAAEQQKIARARTAPKESATVTTPLKPTTREIWEAIDKTS